MGSKAVSTRVITFCHLRDIETWKHTSRLVPKYVQADEYHLFVPASQVAAFRRVTGGSFTVMPDESLGEETINHLEKKMQEGPLVRLGWYRQQFLKILALQQSPSGLNIIWDSDCVPTSRMSYVHEGKIQFSKASEYHPAYFEHISKSLKLTRPAPYSFVASPFAFRREWLDSLQRAVQKSHDTDLINMLLETIDFSLASGFSEYEFLGSWAYENYREELAWREVKWERRGFSRFGPPQSFETQDLEEIAKLYDLEIISFEAWDRTRGASWIMRRLLDLMVQPRSYKLLH